VLDGLRFDAPDLSPVYVAARLMADGNAASLYDHHPYLFNIVPPGTFRETAARCGFTGNITPYVHLPLFAWLSRPLVFLPFSAAAATLLLCNILAVVASLLLTLRLTGLQPTLRWLCVTVIALSCFYPLRYGLRLGQTTPLVFLGLTSLCCLSRSGHQKLSGVLLGLMISLKITPILFLGHFLVKKRWSATIATVITLLAVGAASVVLAGWEHNLAFAHNIIRLSGLSLASWNNQSFDGLLLRWETGGLHLYDWHLLALPGALKAVKCTALACAGLLWFGALLKTANRQSEHGDLLGFSLTIIISVIFSPIAWTHYLLFLAFPCIVLVSRLVHNPTTPCRIWLMGGVIISYIGMALPAPYLLSLLNVPLVHRIPLIVVSSGGFLGGALLLLITLSGLFWQKD